MPKRQPAVFRSALVCALLVACAAASNPTPAETVALGRGSLATLAAVCARLPADAPKDLLSTCAALAKADGVVTEVCPEQQVVNPWPSGGVGGAQ